jgi:hypothetical protein
VSGLFISEVIEGSSNNKCVEIYNGTGAAVNLSGYSLRFYFNGQTTAGQNIALTGSVANGDVYVVCDNDANLAMLAQADQIDNGNFYNGNDAIGLYNGSTAIDIFGRIGEDPGTGWSAGSLNTANSTLVRNGSVWAGNTANAAGFPSLGSEWTGFAQDNSANLGSHSLLSGNPVILTVTDVNGNSSSCVSLVTVEDNVAPVALCQSLTINLASAGSQTVAASSIDNGSSDACGIAGTTLNPDTFTCDDLGVNNVTLTVTDVNGNVGTCSATVTVTNDPLVVTLSSPSFNGGWNVSCAGATDGSITSTTTGGCLPYSYAWSNGGSTANLSGLGAGTYTVTVTDQNGTAASATITLTGPAPLVTPLVAQTYIGGWNVSCNGATDGSLFANTGGGTPAYSWSWSTGATTQMITGLGAGTYTVTVTDQNGCQNTVSATLSEPPVVANTISSAVFACGFNISCNGESDGSIDYTVTGGTPPYAFNWSNGATTEDVGGLTAGTYSVTATDRNGCSISSSITLTQPTAVTASISSGTYACGYNVSCNGATDGNATVNAAGGCAPYSYTWSTGSANQTINGLAAVAVFVTVTDANGCQAFTSYELTEPAPLTGAGTAATFACGFNVSCNGAADGSIDYGAAGGADCLPYSYLWSNGATGEDISGLAAGTYSVTTTDANGCTTTSSFTLSEPAPLAGSGTAAAFACGYNVSCNGSTDGSIDYGVSGGCAPYSYAWSTGATTEDVSNLGAGTYTVTATDANGCSTSNSFTLSQPAVLASTNTLLAYTGGFNIRCFGESNGSATVDFTGGASCVAGTVVLSGPVPGTQSGLGTATFGGLSAGSYTYVVTDANGCTTSGGFTLTQPAAVVSNAGPNVSVNYGYQNISCVTLSGTQSGGVAPYTVRWNEGSSTGALVSNSSSVQVCPSVTTTYCYTVTDANGCTYTDCMVVCVTDIRCGHNLQKITICHFPPGQPTNPQTICIGVPAVAQHVPGHGGDYLGVCGYSDPCTTAKSDEQGSSAAANEDRAGLEVSAFPNPFSEATTVRFKLGATDDVTVQVYSMTGTLVATLFEGRAEAGVNTDVEFRPEGVANGVYLAKVVTKGGEVQVQKLMLNR